MSKWITFTHREDEVKASIEPDSWVSDNLRYLIDHSMSFDVEAHTPNIIKWRAAGARDWVYYIRLDDE